VPTAQVAAHPIAGGGVAGDWVRQPPTTTITAPSGTITTLQATVTWSVSGLFGARSVQKHQVRLRTASGTTVYESAETAGNPGTFLIPYNLSGGSSYLIEVRVTDGSDWSAWASVEVFVDAGDPSAYPDHPGVGQVYEIGINGQGYMLADKADGAQWGRQMIALDPPRFATGDTPFSESVERYSYVSQADWTSGADQKYRNRQDSDSRRFNTSDGLDVFDKEGLRLLPRMVALAGPPVSTTGAAVIASDRLIYHDTGTTFQSRATPNGADTANTFTGFGTMVDWTSDGKYGYFADADQITRWNGITGSPTALWLNAGTSTLSLIEWTTDRLSIVYTSSAGTVIFNTVDDAGLVEVAGGRFIYPAGTEIPAVTSGDGHVFFAVQKFDTCEIKAWKMGSNAAPFTAMVLPKGQSITALGFYLGNLLIRVIETLETGKRMVIYRAVPSDGTLTAQKVMTTLKSSTVDHSTGVWAGDDRFAIFSYRKMFSDTNRGLAAIDLSTGGWAKWSRTEDATDVAITSVFYWKGRLCTAAPNESIETESSAQYIDNGNVIMSTIDMASGLRKVWDSITVTFDPLPTNTLVQAEYSIDNGGSWTVGGSESSAGAKVLEIPVSVEADSFAVRLTLDQTSGNTATPVIKRVAVKCHPLSIADNMLILPVNCNDRCTGLNSRDLVENGSGAGALRAEELQQLVGSRIKLQDVDWKVTGQSSVWEVVSAETTRNAAYSQHEARQQNGMVCQLTLRKPR